ncbi:hypothetical protein [Aeromonas veronii]|uniref:hypothetical protein n=1 Tax=Aeromonas veronii TaxID=654 RepID=UPI002443AB99|nr:hypothetical protein [Aeromonas veronii]
MKSTLMVVVMVGLAVYLAANVSMGGEVMGNYTQGPWKLYRNDQSVGDARGYAVCDVWPRGDDGMASEEGKANARRIVACVNACEGIETEALEEAISMRIDLSSVKQPEIIEALNSAVASLNEAAGMMKWFDVAAAQKMLRTADEISSTIAKAKGGAA